MAGETLTPNIGLQIPAFNQPNWQVPIDYDLNLLDLLLGGQVKIPILRVGDLIVDTLEYSELTGGGILGAVFDGGGSAPAVPLTRLVTVPFDCLITSWTLVCDQVGNCSVDVWFRPGSAPPAVPSVPTSSDLISAAAPISMVGVQTKSGDATAIATWSANLSKWGTLAFRVTSAAFITSINIQLQCKKE